MEDRHYAELANIRLERAQELVLEAEVLLEKEMFKSANNRAYYAIEKALSALLALHKIETKTHSGVLKMFNLEFIRNGDGFFNSEDYMAASEAEHIRNISDYDDFYIASRDQSVRQVQNAKKLVEKVYRVLVKS
ncbi:MAG: HEPN domain-containing protein [Ruminococcus flavefaciens]|nr:HEPN domain-containing protein [Ruminococcus flavefaciens]